MVTGCAGEDGGVLGGGVRWRVGAEGGRDGSFGVAEVGASAADRGLVSAKNVRVSSSPLLYRRNANLGDGASYFLFGDARNLSDVLRVRFIADQKNRSIQDSFRETVRL